VKDDCTVKVFSFPKRHCLLATQGPFIRPTLKDRFLMNTILETVKIVHGTLIQPVRNIGQSEILMLYMTSPLLSKLLKRLNYFLLESIFEFLSNFPRDHLNSFRLITNASRERLDVR
jgi:hypothetical protein